MPKTLSVLSNSTAKKSIVIKLVLILSSWLLKNSWEGTEKEPVSKAVNKNRL